LNFEFFCIEPQISTDPRTQEFRRTQSAQETSTKENRRETLLLSQPISDTSKSGSPSTKKLEGLVAISLQSLPSEKVVCLKRSKSEEVKFRPSGAGADAREESENDEEEEMDEGLRCRTPLLHRSGEYLNVVGGSKPAGERKSRLAKKVSFTTRSSSESETEPPSLLRRHVKLRADAGNGTSYPSDEVHQRTSGGDKKFALVPSEESLVGWNQSGGPFTSQWLFQAVNPMPNRDPATSNKDSGIFIIYLSISLLIISIVSILFRNTWN